MFYGIEFSWNEKTSITYKKSIKKEKLLFFKKTFTFDAQKN
jgi:hypothetical protein